MICTPDYQLLTAGYNGSPAGQPHCTEVGCLMYNGHCIRAHHAEANAITQAAKLGIKLDGASMYCTHRPCINCIKLIIQAGIKAVWYIHEYHTDQNFSYVMATAKAAGVHMELWEELL